jgi:hypothetical protein
VTAKSYKTEDTKKTHCKKVSGKLGLNLEVKVICFSLKAFLSKLVRQKIQKADASGF